MKKFLCLFFALVMVVSMAGCRESNKVAYNVSKAADSFNVERKLTVVNVLSDKILMEMTGTFSITNNSAGELAIICKTGEDEYKKHYVYLNQFTAYTVEDISGADVSNYKYEVTFYPQMIPVADWEIHDGTQE